MINDESMQITLQEGPVRYTYENSSDAISFRISINRKDTTIYHKANFFIGGLRKHHQIFIKPVYISQVSVWNNSYFFMEMHAGGFGDVGCVDMCAGREDYETKSFSRIPKYLNHEKARFHKPNVK